MRSATFALKSAINLFNSGNRVLFSSRQSRIFKYREFATMDSSLFSKHGVIPDVIKQTPPEVAQISYAGDLTITLGNHLTPTLVKDIPVNIKWTADSNALYTLMLVDPDAPSRENPKFGPWHHWLVANIPGNDVSKGEVLSEYIGSAPPEGTGYHRYIFLIYKQKGKLVDAEHGKWKYSADKRNNWDINKFVEKHNLGTPVAANFFQAEYDDYVPTVYKNLSAQ